MKSNFRQVYVYNSDVEAKAKDAVLPSMTALLAVWKAHKIKGTAWLETTGQEGTLLVGDIKESPDGSVASILVRHSDRVAANAVYSDVKADSFIRHEKTPTQGGETGVHIFVSLKPERKFPNRYTMLIEKSPTLDKLLIRRLLNRIIHQEYSSAPSSFSVPSPVGQRTKDGAVRMLRCLPRIELEGRPSATFVKDVQDGRVSYVTLVKAEQGMAVGSVPTLKKKEATLKLTVDHGSKSSNIWGDIKKVIAQYATEYPSALVSFKLPDRKKAVSVRVNSNNALPLDDLYVKSHDITAIFPPLDTSSKNVVEHFAQRAIPLLISERDV